jgi:ankyrin repeat protein
MAFAIHRATFHGYLKVVQLLIEHGALINSQDGVGDTALHIAANSTAREGVDIMRHLIDKGASTEIWSRLGYTPIMCSCSSGSAEQIEALLAAKANYNVQTYSGTSLLHLISDNNDAAQLASLFLELVQMGLDPHGLDECSCTPLHSGMLEENWASCILNGNVRIEDMREYPLWLFRSYATPWLTTTFRMVKRRMSSGQLKRLLSPRPDIPHNAWSPLCILANKGEERAVQNALSLGIDVDFIGCPSGTALMVACEAGHLETVKVLVRHGAKFCQWGLNGFSAIQAAGPFNEIVEWLLVGRHTDQRRLMDKQQAGPDTPSQEMPISHWGGVVQQPLGLVDDMAKRPTEALKDYLGRLAKAKRMMRGNIAPPPATGKWPSFLVEKSGSSPDDVEK